MKQIESLLLFFLCYSTLATSKIHFHHLKIPFIGQETQPSRNPLSLEAESSCQAGQLCRFRKYNLSQNSMLADKKRITIFAFKGMF